jgi:uncharacterized protein YcnI
MLVLTTAGPASAPIGVEGEVPAGGNGTITYGTITFRVPNESESAATTEVSIPMPEEAPLGR